jgi:hypothetical protein
VTVWWLFIAEHRIQSVRGLGHRGNMEWVSVSPTARSKDVCCSLLLLLLLLLFKYNLLLLLYCVCLLHPPRAEWRPCFDSRCAGHRG